MTPCPGLPDEVAVPVQDRHHLVQVAQRFVSPAEHGQDARPAHEHPPGVHPAGCPHRAVEMDHAAGGSARQDHRRADAGPYVRFALRLAASLGRAERAPHFGEPVARVAEIPQRDAGCLMGDGGLGGADWRTTR